MQEGCHAARLVRLEEELDAGQRLPEGELVRALLSPRCSGRLVERLATYRWVLGSRRVLPLVVRHPACPRPFAWEALPHLGWHDLLQVARYPRAAPQVRRQAERKLLDRLPQLAAGERVSLARFAPRSVIAALLASNDVACVDALLNNASFTASDALRLMTTNRHAGCLLALIHHQRWGRVRGVTAAALASRLMPVAVLLGLLATCTTAELAGIADANEIASPLREAARELIDHRQGRTLAPPTCTSSGTP